MSLSRKVCCDEFFVGEGLVELSRLEESISREIVSKEESRQRFLDRNCRDEFVEKSFLHKNTFGDKIHHIKHGDLEDSVSLKFVAKTTSGDNFGSRL